MQEHGYIKISLKCEDMSTKETIPTMAMVELTVTDTGKGISRAYMDTKMFTSWAQENPMAPRFVFEMKFLGFSSN